MRYFYRNVKDGRLYHPDARREGEDYERIGILSDVIVLKADQLYGVQDVVELLTRAKYAQSVPEDLPRRRKRNACAQCGAETNGSPCTFCLADRRRPDTSYPLVK